MLRSKSPYRFQLKNDCIFHKEIDEELANTLTTKFNRKAYLLFNSKPLLLQRNTYGILITLSRNPIPNSLETSKAQKRICSLNSAYSIPFIPFIAVNSTYSTIFSI